jgi:hypothetical protein
MAKCQANNQKGLPCPLVALEGRDVCHSHAKMKDKEEKRRAEDAERATRGVKLCSGGNRLCPKAAEIPLQNKSTVCAECVTFHKERESVNRAKREGLVAARNKEKKEKGLLECKLCRRDLPVEEFTTQRKKTSLRLGVGEDNSDRCRECREKAAKIVAASKAKHVEPDKQTSDLVAASKAKHVEPDKQTSDLSEEKGEAKSPQKRLCSRDQKVSKGCWKVLPDSYDGLTCTPCVELLREFREWKRAKKEEGEVTASDGSLPVLGKCHELFEDVHCMHRWITRPCLLKVSAS